MRIELMFFCFVCFFRVHDVYAEISPFVIPGAVENDVRSALPLTNCVNRKVAPEMIDCASTRADFDGVPAIYSVTFLNGRLIFTHVYFHRENYSHAATSVSKLMGEPNYTEDAAYHAKMGLLFKGVPQESKVWGNQRLFAQIFKFAPGRDDYATVFFLHPDAVPAESHENYLPPK